jgi:hypothetical protein
LRFSLSRWHRLRDFLLASFRSSQTQQQEQQAILLWVHQQTKIKDEAMMQTYATSSSTSRPWLALLSLLLLVRLEPSAADAPCNICGDGFSLGNILAQFNGVPCSEIKRKGDNGEFQQPEECNKVKASGFFEACECKVDETAAPITPAAPTTPVSRNSKARS